MRISIAVAISMTLSSLVGYVYFYNVISKQKIADEITNQHQIVNQLNFIDQDIENFSKSVIVDLVLEEKFTEKVFDNEFQRLKKADEVVRRMTFYNSLKDYVASTFIRLEDGQLYSSINNIDYEDEIDKKLNNDIFTEFSKHSEWTYSEPYISHESWIQEPIVCYSADMWDTQNFGEKIGTFYLEIYLKYFTKQVELYSENYDNVCLLGNNQEVLFEKDKDNKIKAFINNVDVDINEGVYRVDGNYFIFSNIEKSNWKLCTLITREHLWNTCKNVLYFFLLSLFISIGLVILSTINIIDKTTLPITKLSNKMSKSTYDKIEIGEIEKTGDEVQTLYECYQEMVLEIERGVQEQIKNEKLKKEMEFDVILSQTNPHYLYNVLNTIVYLAADNKNDDIVNITKSLIYTLQTTLSVGEYGIETTIYDELELISCYTNIQKYRYPEMFDIEIICPKELLEYKILKTSIQPLVENAIIHGILPTYKYGKIAVIIKVQNNNLIINVTDNGCGMNNEVLIKFKENKDMVFESDGRKHIGINNIRDRIQYLYGEPYNMEIAIKQEGGTSIILTLPTLK